MMSIITEDSSSYTTNQIQKGLDKSVKDNDIIINTSIDNIIKNIDQFEFKIGSVESFLNDDSNFIFDSLPDKLISYIQDKGLDIDISKLIEYNNFKKEYMKNEDDISLLTYTSREDDDSEVVIDRLIKRNEELYPYFDLLRDEVLRVKQEINRINSLMTEDRGDYIPRDSYDQEYEKEYPRWKKTLMKILNSEINSYVETDDGIIMIFFNKKNPDENLIKYDKIKERLWYSYSLSEELNEYMPGYIPRHFKYAIQDYFKHHFPDYGVKEIVAVDFI